MFSVVKKTGKLPYDIPSKGQILDYQNFRQILGWKIFGYFKILKLLELVFVILCFLSFHVFVSQISTRVDCSSLK